MNHTQKFVFTLYVAIIDEASEKQIRNLRNALAECFKGISWVLNLVEVMDMPEKAIANDIFVTPTLVREVPEPEIKLLGGLDNIPQMLNAIRQTGSQ